MGLYVDGKEIIKDLISIAKSIDNMELKDKILEMQNTFYELTDENRELRLENESMKNVEIIKSNLEWSNNAYRKIGTKEEFYCPRCLDDEGKLIRMQLIAESFSITYSTKCTKCETQGNTDIKHGFDWSF